MTDWSNWEKKKKELNDYLKQAENEIEKKNVIEARDILVKVVYDIDYVLALVNQ